MGRNQQTPPHPPGQNRVALFTGNYNHIADGVSLTLNRLVAYLLARGDQVLVFGPTVQRPQLEHAGDFVAVPSVPAPGRPEYRIAVGLPRAARQRLLAFEPNLFHIATPDILGLRALRVSRSLGVPAVASYHTHFSSYLSYYRLRFLEGIVWSHLRRFYHRCRHVYVPSESMRDVLLTHGVDAPLKLWERGVDTSFFNPGRRSYEWRQTRGLEEDTPVVTFVSRLVWEKGLDVFSDVVVRLERDGVRHRSLVVGDGPARDGLERRLPNTVFTGYLKGEELATAYASADVFVFPSETETFGNVTLEAMASGLPVVCADATGSRSLVRPGENGFLAKARSSDEFYSHTRRLVENTELRTSMSEAASDMARRFEWSIVLDRLAGYYGEVIRGDDPSKGFTD